MKRAFATTALAVAASVSTHVHAQSTNTTELDPILISGGISPISADEYGRSSTVITRQQIEDRGYSTVQEALEAQPGVSINGSAPTDRQIRIRGGEGNHTLVLIDGVRAAPGDTAFFGYILRGLDAAYVERIEILRGPQSVPFGTDAASGVINIVTREAGEGLRYGGSVEFGEGDRQNAYLSHGGDASRISVNLSNLNDRGFDYSGGDGNRDGRRWEAASAKGELDLTGQTTLGFSLRAADAAYDLDDDNDAADSAAGYVVDADFRTELAERAGSVYVDHSALNGGVSHRLRLDRTTEKRDTFDDFPRRDDIKTEVANYRLQMALDGATTTSSDQLLSVLLERREDRDRDGEGERDNNSAALEYRGWMTDSASLQAGVRRDNNSEFANEITWNVAGSYFLDNGVRWHASAGRAVVNPSFFEISTQDESGPDLEPEKNVGYDIGVEIPLPQASGYVDITYFNETLDNDIVFEGVFLDATAVNSEGESDRQGVEFTAFLTPLDSLDVSLSYTYIDATNPAGEIETRRPRNEVGLNATWRLPDGATTLSGDLRYVRGLFDQQRWEDGNPIEQLPNFTVVNLAASHALTDNVDLTTRVTNVFDEDYQEVWGYATRGRAVFAGLRASW